MTIYTDRCAAVTAALRNLARDFEADLGKAARFRGYDGSTVRGAYLRDPGENLDVFQRQLVEHGATPTPILDAYRNTAKDARGLVHPAAAAGAETDARNAVFALADAIQQVHNHDDAVALVATFES